MKWLLLLTTMLLSVEAYGVAFCALRDPVQQIKTLYPNYVAYESEVRNIKAAQANARLSETGLPVFLHAKEIGKHTLFYILGQQDLLGFVHVRSEPGDWGLVEIAWALNPQGEIVDYTFQRCRGGYCAEAESRVFRDYFKGLSTAGLSEFFNEAGEIVPPKAVLNQNLYQTMVLSAIKTLVLTDAFWQRND